MAEATPTIYDKYITSGMDKAQTLVDNQKAATYTPYTSSAAAAPVKTAMYDYNANAPLQQQASVDYKQTAGAAPTYQGGNYDVGQQNAAWNGYSAQAYNGTAPTYSGLMQGDYDKLQAALAVGGNQAAQNAYNTGSQNLNNTMSGRGLYGSSIMQQQQTQGLDRELMRAQAANESQAAATRYGMEQNDLTKTADMQMAAYQQKMQEQQAMNAINSNQSLAQNAQGMQQAQMNQAGMLANASNRLSADQNKNAFGLDLYGQSLAAQKDLNAYNAQETAGLRAQNSEMAKFGAMNADSLNQYNNLNYNADKQYNEQLNNWNNQQNYEKNFLYPQAQQAFNQSQQEMLMNQSLALAGQGAPLAAAQQNNILSQQQTAAQVAAAKQNSTNQLIGAGVGLLGDIGGAYAGSDAGSTALSNLW